MLDISPLRCPKRLVCSDHNEDAPEDAPAISTQHRHSDEHGGGGDDDDDNDDTVRGDANARQGQVCTAARSLLNEMLAFAIGFRECAS